MKFRKKLCSLKDTDSSTAKRIEEEFPADWDMDKVFASSYKKYLSMKNKSEENISEIRFVNSEEHLAEIIKPHHKFRCVILNITPVAACFALIWGLSKLINMTPVPVEEDKKPNELNTMPPSVEETNEYESSSAEHTFYTYISDENIINNETVSVSYDNDTENDNITSADDEQQEMQNADESQIIPPATEPEFTNSELVTEVSVLPPVTKPEITNSELTTEVPVLPPVIEFTTTYIEDMPPSVVDDVTEDEPTPPMDNVEKGYFEWIEGSGDEWHKLVYVFPPDMENETVTEHNISFEGFTTTKKNDAYSITDDNTGVNFLIYITSYDEFALNCNPKFTHNITYMEVNQNPACLVDNGKEDSFCHLLFDDGCHIIHIVGLLSDFDTMMYLAENFN